MNKQDKQVFIECECGARIFGISMNHARSLLPAHKRSVRHKELMEIKGRKEKS